MTNYNLGRYTLQLRILLVLALAASVLVSAHFAKKAHVAAAATPPATPAPRQTVPAISVIVDGFPPPCVGHGGIAIKTLSDDHAAWMCADGYVFRVSTRVKP